MRKSASHSRTKDAPSAAVRPRSARVPATTAAPAPRTTEAAQSRSRARTRPPVQAQPRVPTVPLVLVDVPRRLIAVGKQIPPLAVDPPPCPPAARSVVSPIEGVQIATAPADVLAVTNGLWVHRDADQLRPVEPHPAIPWSSEPRITSMDFALLSLTDWWMRTGLGDQAVCDLDQEVLPHAASMLQVKTRLMGLWRQPFQPKPDHPLHDRKPVLQLHRQLDAAGWTILVKDQGTDEERIKPMVYRAAPSIGGILRARWLESHLGMAVLPSRA